MTDLVWIKLRDAPHLSWHIVRTEGVTLCGRETTLSSPVSDDLPAGKSCETCLRIHAHNEEA